MSEKELSGAKDKQRLIGNDKERVSFSGSGIRRILRSGRLRIWYICYVCTASLVAVAALAILLFGTGNNGDALGGELSFGSISDKVAHVFTELGFISSSKDTQVSDGWGDQNIFPQDKNDPPGKIPSNDGQQDSTDNGGELTDDVDGINDAYVFDHTLVPDGATPIIPMDLSLSQYGDGYINNSTGYSPDIATLFAQSLQFFGEVSVGKPRVLIVHTHGTEAYSDSGAIYCDDIEDYARSADTQKNVVAVGRVISDILSQRGIETLHCTVMHDGTQYKDSYSRAEQTIRKYLAEYPSIELVIDVHRDAIVRSNGDIVRPIAVQGNDPVAQVMCVVGSDLGGELHDGWEGNLSLALKLRQLLNQKCRNICRPTMLRPNSYNQELSKYSLLLEIGSSGNSLEEAKAAAVIVAETIAELIRE